MKQQLLCGLVLAFLMTLPVLAQSTTVAAGPFNPAMQGLGGVYVLVENLSPTLEQDGLHQSALKAGAELQIKKAGIKVMTHEEAMADPRQPYLYIVVGSMKTGGGLHAYSASVECRQMVGLLSDPDTHIEAATWMSRRVTGAVSSNQTEWIGEDVASLVDDFIKEYQLANPQ